MEKSILSLKAMEARNFVMEYKGVYLLESGEYLHIQDLWWFGVKNVVGFAAINQNRFFDFKADERNGIVLNRGILGDLIPDELLEVVVKAKESQQESKMKIFEQILSLRQEEGQA